MDKDLDHGVYSYLEVSLPDNINFFRQKKVLLTRIVKLSTTDSRYAFAAIGKISFQFGQYQKSLIQLKKATIIDPDNSYAQASLAEVLFKLERENEALSILKNALCLHPADTGIHLVIIERLKEQERLGDSESFYQEIVNMFIDPKLVADLYYGSAQVLTRYNEHSKALGMYKKAYKANPEAGYTYEYAFALYHEGEFVEARVQFDKLREWNPTSNIFVNNVAFMTYCSGRLQEALEEIEEIIANGLVSPATYSNLILVLYQMDKDEEVINIYRDLLQQNLGENGPILRSMYEEALRITRAILDRDDIDEETRGFNTKKIEGIKLVLSFIT